MNDRTYTPTEAGPHEHADPHQHGADMLAVEELTRLAQELREDLCLRKIPAELRELTFAGGEGIFELLDDVGSPALSFGVINPVNVTAYINFHGGPARSGNAVPVPPRSSLVMPVSTPGHVKLGLEESELGAETATIYRLRFHTVQPFFLGSL